MEGGVRMQIGRVTAPAPTGHRGHRGHPWRHAWLRAIILALALLAGLAAGPLPGAAAPAPGGSPPGAQAPSGEGVLLRLALREGETHRYAVTLDLSGVIEEQGFESAGAAPSARRRSTASPSSCAWTPPCGC